MLGRALVKTQLARENLSQLGICYTKMNQD